MSTDSSTAGGEPKSSDATNNNNNRPPYGRNSNKGQQQRNRPNNNAKFTGLQPHLPTFEGTGDYNKMIDSFQRADEALVTHAATESDIYVIKGLRSDKRLYPEEPEPVLIKDKEGKDTDDMTKTEEVKYRMKLQMYETRRAKIDEKFAQLYSVWYGQCDPDVISSTQEEQ